MSNEIDMKWFCSPVLSFFIILFCFPLLLANKACHWKHFECRENYRCRQLHDRWSILNGELSFIWIASLNDFSFRFVCVCQLILYFHNDWLYSLPFYSFPTFIALSRNRNEKRRENLQLWLWNLINTSEKLSQSTKI